VVNDFSEKHSISIVLIDFHFEFNSQLITGIYTSYAQQLYTMLSFTSDTTVADKIEMLFLDKDKMLEANSLHLVFLCVLYSST